MSERLNQQKSFDVLGDVLETLHFRGSIFFRSDLAAPWGMSLEKSPFPKFHIALSGECYVGADANDAVRVQEQDVIMLPNGSSHWISDQPGRDLVPSSIAGDACELNTPLFQEGKITNRLICGVIQFDQEMSHPIFDALPSVMLFTGLSSSGPIWSMINLIDTEMNSANNWNAGVVDRLAEVLFIQLMNHYVSRVDDSTGFLAALSDRRVYRALSLIHKEPGLDWTLSLLGERSGMSKATLVRRFQEVLGVAPMRYISDWRVMKAYNLVKYTVAPLEQIADSLGFSSSRTLTRAFHRHYECTPSVLRKSIAK
ncbi:MAG: AraC family transcriptional regulator [SAR86 cluster bacterium]|uniref:AraC family transcriptional regulator n=1 Tax=SAR86 cluster bacterium TaxID=2030880 RepID=A0A2A4X0M2_9GAMM|nr:MAG: AraC family transcriptional regulator [SAR86 cluster bacterium]